ncbi:MAG: homocysteine biosynthesis protein, partial [Candidatus Omnitrophota bacterium]
NVAVNLSDRAIYTYMGMLKPGLGNANYSSAGQLSPLLKDPYYRTIGIGTRIFLGGGIGYVSWQGTQHNPAVARSPLGVPVSGAGTLSVIGDLKQMKAQWLRGTSMLGYGATLTVGIGVPIPVLDEKVVACAAVRDEDIFAQVVDYGHDYPQGVARSLGQVTYAQLKSGKIEVQGREVPTGGLSSYSRAKDIAEELKSWIARGEFMLTEPVAPLPGVESGYVFRPLKERPLY